MISREDEVDRTPPRASRSVPITFRVSLIIVASLVVGIGALVSYLAWSQYTKAIEATDTALRQQSQILYYSIRNLMLPGEAPIAVGYIRDIRNTGLDYEIRLFRTNGVEAFSDNATIRTVNANNDYRGAKIFLLKPEEEYGSARWGLKADEPHFREAAEKGQEALSQVVREGRIIRTLYSPLLNNPPCAECHGADHKVRGVIRITVDLTEELAGPRRNLVIAGGFFLLLVALLALVLTQFLRRSVIEPVKRIAEVCTSVTAGRFDQRVALARNDEIGELGRTVNQMVEGLFERFQLSKFVSASTLRSIRDGAQGKRIHMAILFSDVRGFTSYSEANPPETVVGHLNRILSVQTDIIHRRGGDVDKYVGDEVIALFTGEDGELRACASALEIQRELAANRDGLYGGLAVGIGIDSGEVILGMIGSDKRADYTVIGDHVNNTARLCSIARPNTILVSESVHDKVNAHAIFGDMFLAHVKGKQKEQQVYVLQGLTEGS
jgi:adenylate cyclase